MSTVEKIVLGLAIIWPIWQVFHIRKQVITGGIIIPPLVTSVLVFGLFVVGVVMLQFSPLHLIWLFVLSFIFGILLTIFPVVQKIIIFFLALLTGSASRAGDE